MLNGMLLLGAMVDRYGNSVHYQSRYDAAVIISAMFAFTY
jgi:cytochrome c-type biogenesis protein CcmH/NrfF